MIAPAPETCPACGGRKTIDSDRFRHYFCGAVFSKEYGKCVGACFVAHDVAVKVRENFAAEMKAATEKSKPSPALDLSETKEKTT